MSGISAEVVLDSVSPAGDRLTTMVATFHRFVLAEFNTHRVMSRNSASSRAIPVAKQIAMVREHPAIPVSFPAEQRGMQGGDEVANPDLARQTWLAAVKDAISYAEILAADGVHKSIVNRILEPYMYHTVIVTATEWDGFWHQRCSPLAQPEIRVAAEAMKAAYDASGPTPLGIGEWHTPFIQPDEPIAFWEGAALMSGGVNANELRKQVSAARCARVSYLTHDGRRNITADLTLHERLVTADPGHWSPLEHVATPCDGNDEDAGVMHLGNFTGWDQYRHEMDRF